MTDMGTSAPQYPGRATFFAAVLVATLKPHLKPFAPVNRSCLPVCCAAAYRPHHVAAAQTFGAQGFRRCQYARAWRHGGAQDPLEMPVESAWRIFARSYEPLISLTYFFL